MVACQPGSRAMHRHMGSSDMPVYVHITLQSLGWTSEVGPFHTLALQVSTYRVRHWYHSSSRAAHADTAA